MSIAVANRYARALADVIGPTGDYRLVVRELEGFAAAYQECADLREVFDTPAVSLPEKTKVLEAVLARLKASRITINFLRVLLANYRMGLLEEIKEAFQKVLNDRLGIVQVRVLSASGLSKAEQEALRARFVRLTSKQVELKFDLDDTLLGGVVAQIGSTVYDGSIRGHLERLRQQLVGGGL